MATLTRSDGDAARRNAGAAPAAAAMATALVVDWERNERREMGTGFMRDDPHSYRRHRQRASLAAQHHPADIRVCQSVPPHDSRSMPVAPVSTSVARERTPEPVLQFSVFTPNRLGRLHELVQRLARREVHIMALSVLDTTDSTILRLVVDDPDGARQLLEEHGFAYVECALVAVEIDDERQLQDVLAALLEAELNIHYTYPFLTRPGGKAALAINIEHPDVAEDALRRHQFRVLHQADISR